jgi:NAD dependent epimerase/dehydratase family enzyme
MRVFVTGGTGFVGKPTVRRLVEDGHEVRCLVRRTSVWSSDCARGLWRLYTQPPLSPHPLPLINAGSCRKP